MQHTNANTKQSSHSQMVEVSGHSCTIDTVEDDTHDSSQPEIVCLEIVSTNPKTPFAVTIRSVTQIHSHGRDYAIKVTKRNTQRPSKTFINLGEREK